MARGYFNSGRHGRSNAASGGIYQHDARRNFTVPYSLNFMDFSNRWLLPDGVSEILPPDAARLESLGRRLLDLYATWGYELVIPPFIEYLDSLLVGTGADLNIKTFKLTDRLTGRLMGIHADMTPQVARIDAHSLKRETPTRLCYLGTVLHTLPSGFALSRAPLQAGAELYGHAGIASDLEILNLMLETLWAAHIQDFYLDVGHVAIYRGLAQQAALNPDQEHELFSALQRKAQPEIQSLLATWQVKNPARDMLSQLPFLYGEVNILNEARRVLAAATIEVHTALDELDHLAAQMTRCKTVNCNLHFDLAELRGYSYHTGAVFAAYISGHGQAVAQGGRYNHIGEAFGRARPATGFSTDLHVLVALSDLPFPAREAILAPALSDPTLTELIRNLRQQGKIVIQQLPGQTAQETGCRFELRQQAGAWTIAKIS